MRFQSIFAEKNKGGLSPVKTDEVKGGDISAFGAESNQSRQTA